MSNSVPESEFYMWRTLFAVAHADGVVTTEEVRFMAEALEDHPFNEEQKEILSDDIKEPKDPSEMFEKIGDAADQARFFKFARDLVWVDGDFGGDEQKVMVDLISKHIKTIDFDKLVNEVDLHMELDNSQDTPVRRAPEKKRSFFRRFLDSFSAE